MKATQRIEESLKAGDTAAISFEFFVPDSEDGKALLRSRIDKMASQDPLFIDIMGWGDEDNNNDASTTTSSSIIDQPPSSSSTTTTTTTTTKLSVSHPLASSIDLAAFTQKHGGVAAAIHVGCGPSTTSESITRILDTAKHAGVRNVIVERLPTTTTSSNTTTSSMSPSSTPSSSSILDTVASSLPPTTRTIPTKALVVASILDGVKFIRSTYGDCFCIGVPGYPPSYRKRNLQQQQQQQDNTNNDHHYATDLAELRLQQDAGADFVLAQHVLEAKTFLTFRKDAETTGLRIPIIPTIFPIYSATNFFGVNDYCGLVVPPTLQAEILKFSTATAAAGGGGGDGGDDETTTSLNDSSRLFEFGTQWAVSLCRELLANNVRVLHFITMNLDSAVSAILRGLGLSGPEAASRRKLPWRSAVQDDERAQSEEMRPIFWANRPAAYVERTSHWTKFPKGRWKTAREDGDAASAVALFSPFSTSFQHLDVPSAESPKPSGGSGSSTVGVATTSTSVASSSSSTPFLSSTSQASASLSYEETAAWKSMIAGSFAAGTPEQRRHMWGANPSDEKHIWSVFAGYMSGRVPRLPWCEKTLLPETSMIASQLVRLNKEGFLTINSQPRVNGARSDDATVGWGGGGANGGYVYQKAYVECFVPPGHLAALMEAIASPSSSSSSSSAVSTSGSSQSHHHHQHTTPTTNSISYTAMNAEGLTYSSRRLDCAAAVTWGVFPDREIVQPTIVEYNAFKAWREEAFALWYQQWASIYEEGSEAADLISRIADEYFLVNIIDNDYIKGDVFRVFEDALKIRKQKGDRLPQNVAATFRHQVVQPTTEEKNAAASMKSIASRIQQHYAAAAESSNTLGLPV